MISRISFLYSAWCRTTQAGLGIRSLALCSFAQNCSYKRATVGDSLSFLFKKSDREQIDLVALYKRATMSK